MIGVTIGVGAHWQKMAELAAAQMQRMTDIECVVAPESLALGLSSPSWAKAKIPDHYKDDVLIFDADLWCQKRWNPEAMLGDRDIAVVAERANGLNRVETALYDFPSERYINAGLILLSFRSKIMEPVFSYHPAYGRWLEQDALNREVHRLPQHSVRWLPYAYNDMVPATEALTTPDLHNRHSVNLHFAGGKDPEMMIQLYHELHTTTI